MKSLASYEDAKGNIKLRQQIVRLMRESRCRSRVEEIIITNGCLESINLALRCIAKSGDTIAVESPTYFGVLQTLETLGMKVLEIPTHPQTGIDPAALDKVVRTRKITGCVLIPTFSNPLGSCMPEKNKKQVYQILSDAKIPIIEDDIYGG